MGVPPLATPSYGGKPGPVKNWGSHPPCHQRPAFDANPVDAPANPATQRGLGIDW